MQFNVTLNHGRTRLELLCVSSFSLRKHVFTESVAVIKCIHKRDICDFLNRQQFVICGVRLDSSHQD